MYRLRQRDALLAASGLSTASLWLPDFYGPSSALSAQWPSSGDVIGFRAASRIGGGERVLLYVVAGSDTSSGSSDLSVGGARGCQAL